MNTKQLISWVAAAVAAATAVTAWAAGPRTHARPTDRDNLLRVAMVSDGGSFADNSFNQSCREGLEELLYAGAPLFVQFHEPLPSEDFGRQLGAFAERGYRLVIGIGYLMERPLAKLAKEYPETFFVGVDTPVADPPPNLQVLSFQVDECAFPAGYLAAAWAAMQDPSDPAVAWIGGRDVDSVNQFVTGFTNGVAHFNKVKRKKVRVEGRHVGTFTDEGVARAAAEEYIDGGADVVFGVAGKAGTGAIRAAHARGKWAIGVDTDQYYTLPKEGHCLLTSCLKRMDRAVKTVVQGVLEYQFWGGSSYVGNLANHGIGLAPFHDFEAAVPLSVKHELFDIQRALIKGRLSTGWPKAETPE
ncbi:MAG: BMP family ABC transporter substrate-binding protein [Kiritimatiellae bacterium]|nr:BMP family ABC transporter substrate-binding protein [Kiritimatiellia bacterium]